MKKTFIKARVLLICIAFQCYTEGRNVTDQKCSLEQLKDNLNIVECLPGKVDIRTSEIPHETTCTVNCTLGSSGQTWRQCMHGYWEGPPIDCREGVNTDTHVIKENKRATVCVFTNCSPPQSRSGNDPVLRCPSDITAIADPYQTHTKVTWPEPTATDDRDGNISPTRHGMAPGLLFSEGKTQVGYSARDRAGNMASCVFYIIIKVTRCERPPRIPDGWRICHPSTDFVRAADCIAGCYGGHDLIGASRFKCLDSGKWSEAYPICEKKKCPDLRASVNTGIRCTDAFLYRSVCTYTCYAGYGVANGMSRVRVCQEDGSWRGREPKCIDNERPYFASCPNDQVAVAERGTSSASVSWPLPITRDNSKETVSSFQTKGSTPGSIFTAGIHHIEYTSKDSTNNIAKPCKFKVIVREIICHTLYPRVYQTVSCPSGYGYGSTCEFDCTTGTSLIGGPSLSTVHCELNQAAGSPAYGVWSFGARYPACESTATCPVLKPPNNGAMVCDNWYGGEICKMMCRKGYDIPKENRGFEKHELLICGISGNWNLIQDFQSQLPKTCQKITKQNVRFRMKLHFYFDGACSDITVQEEIKDKFIQSLQSSFGCQNGDCLKINIIISCGREKRDISDNQHISDITAIVKSDNDSTTEEMNEKIQKLVQAAISLNQQNITIGDKTLQILSVDTPNVASDCLDGYVAAATSLACTPCTIGQYHNTSTDQCLRCPRGRYQNIEGTTNCVACPDGTTTRSDGATDMSQCESACPSGTSSSNGISPCTPCSKGYYQPDIGQTTCLRCPDSQSTDKQGTSNITQCLDFDIKFLESDNETSVTYIMSEAVTTENISVNLWFQCSVCGQLFQLLDNSSAWLILNISQKPAILTINDKQYLIDLSSTNDNWNHIGLNLSPQNVKIWFNSEIILDRNVISSSHHLSSVLLGGGGFVGSLSQLHIWDTIETVAIQNTKCHHDKKGSVLQWENLIIAGYVGAFSDLPSNCDDTDNCRSHPCQNNATCTDGFDYFTCNCSTGFTGDRCHVNINDCVDDVCNNNGVCVDDIDDFYCNCPANYSGKYCEIVVVDGGWTKYGNWSVCSVTCGNGTRERKRVCDNPTPDNGGSECEGSDTEVAECSMDTCKVCETIKPPEKGYVECDNSSDTITCTTGCDDGYMMDIPPLNQYICGPATFYEWNYHSKYNPYKRLPYCSKTEQATTLAVSFTGEYNGVNCDNHNLKTQFQVLAENRVRELVSKVDCMKSSHCSLKTVNVDVCGSGDDARKKRSLDTDGIEIEVIISTINNQDQNKKLEHLKAAISALNNFAFNEEFTVDVLQNSYVLNTNTTQSEGKAGCVDGSWSFDISCVPCGWGSYMKDGLCELCEFGFYTDKMRQTECKPCPEGKTTQGIGSRDQHECSVDVEVNYEKGVTVSITLVVSLTVGAVILLVTGIILAKNNRRICGRKHPQFDVSAYELNGKPDNQIPKLAWSNNNSSK